MGGFGTPSRRVGESVGGVTNMQTIIFTAIFAVLSALVLVQGARMVGRDGRERR
jgi:hypothetical protein